LRGVEQNFAHNPKEISSLHPELVLRQIPGKSTQRRRQTQRFRALFFRTALLHPACDVVIGIPSTPSGLRFLAPGRLAIGFTTRALTLSYSGIGAEPSAAD
jgi:hypothetical protein